MSKQLSFLQLTGEIMPIEMVNFLQCIVCLTIVFMLFKVTYKRINYNAVGVFLRH